MSAYDSAVATDPVTLIVAAVSRKPRLVCVRLDAALREPAEDGSLLEVENRSQRANAGERPVPPRTPARPVAAMTQEMEPAGRAGNSFFRELPFLIVVAFVLALLIKAFLIQAFYIPSSSMEQTLAVRDRVLVNKLVYKFRDIHRGEIVVFNGLDSFTPETDIPEPQSGLGRLLRGVSSAVGVGAPGEKDFIKRVIGVPGDRVACCTNGHVTVQPESTKTPIELIEPYVFEDNSEAFCAAGLGEVSCPPGSEGVLVPEGRLWVMGDHRSQSSDSRAHIDDRHSGTVPQDKVIGRAFVVVWPLDRVALLSVPEIFDGPAQAAPGAFPYALGALLTLPLRATYRRGGRLRALVTAHLSLPGRIKAVNPPADCTYGSAEAVAGRVPRAGDPNSGRRAT
jgi:signal peptidase I